MRLTNRVRADEGFGRYYGRLRIWQNVRRTDLMWSSRVPGKWSDFIRNRKVDERFRGARLLINDVDMGIDQFTTKADIPTMAMVRIWWLGKVDWDW